MQKPSIEWLVAATPFPGGLALEPLGMMCPAALPSGQSELYSLSACSGYSLWAAELFFQGGPFGELYHSASVHSNWALCLTGRALWDGWLIWGCCRSAKAQAVGLGSLSVCLQVLL